MAYAFVDYEDKRDAEVRILCARDFYFIFFLLIIPASEMCNFVNKSY